MADQSEEGSNQNNNTEIMPLHDETMHSGGSKMFPPEKETVV